MNFKRNEVYLISKQHYLLSLLGSLIQLSYAILGEDNVHGGMVKQDSKMKVFAVLAAYGTFKCSPSSLGWEWVSPGWRLRTNSRAQHKLEGR